MKATRKRLVLAPLVALLACGGPIGMIPGGALSGTETAPPADWSSVDSSFMDLELRPDDPYSVTINYFVKDGKLYIDPSPDREWAKILAGDDRVRVRFGFGDEVYPLRAVRVSEPGETYLDFDPARAVYRLDPR